MAQIKIVVGCDSCGTQFEMPYPHRRESFDQVDIALYVRIEAGWGYRSGESGVAELHCLAHRGDPSIRYEGS